MSARIAYILIFLISVFRINAQDIWPPDTPELDSVSVYDNVNGYSIVSWFPCDSTDVVGYYIYRNLNVNWEKIDSVYVPNTFYIDYTAESHYHPELYRIAAFDEEGNLSMMTALEEYHNTLYIFPYQETENCQPLLRLHWNRYLNWPEGVKEYQIWQSVDFGAYTLLTTIPGDVNGYQHFNIIDTTSYCFYVKAISNQNKTSTSNITCIYVDYPNIPSYVNIEYVTVTATGNIEISSTMDNTAQVRNFRLERAHKGSSVFSTIASVSNYSQSTWTYTDNPDIFIEWVYRVVATDACGNNLHTSNTATNVVVNGYADRELNHFLSWNHYRYFSGDVDGYNVYRKIDDGTPEYITTVSDTSYTDNVADFADGRSYGKFTYFVYALESTVLPGKGYFSLSSSKELIQFSRVFIPNTFTPNSDTLNAVFKPFISFVQKDGYYFAVYSRWGNKLFQTNDINEGWDGQHKGKPMKQDSYVYILKYVTSEGNVKEESGYVYIYYPLAN